MKARIPEKIVRKIVGMVERLAPGAWLFIYICFDWDIAENVYNYVGWHFAMNGKPINLFNYDICVPFLFIGGEATAKEARETIIRKISRRVGEVELV